MTPRRRPVPRSSTAAAMTASPPTWGPRPWWSTYRRPITSASHLHPCPRPCSTTAIRSIPMVCYGALAPAVLGVEAASHRWGSSPLLGNLYFLHVRTISHDMAKNRLWSIPPLQLIHLAAHKVRSITRASAACACYAVRRRLPASTVWSSARAAVADRVVWQGTASNSLLSHSCFQAAALSIWKSAHNQAAGAQADGAGGDAGDGHQGRRQRRHHRLGDRFL